MKKTKTRFERSPSHPGMVGRLWKVLKRYARPATRRVQGAALSECPQKKVKSYQLV